MQIAPFEFHAAGSCNGVVGVRLAQFLLETVRSLEGVRDVIDLGCGNGYFAKQLLAAGYDVVGVDASSTGIALANAQVDDRTKGKFFLEKIDASLADRLPRKCFDCAVSSDVIEHLYRPADLLEGVSGR